MLFSSLGMNPVGGQVVVGENVGGVGAVGEPRRLAPLASPVVTSEVGGHVIDGA